MVGAVSMLVVMAGGSWLLGAHFGLGLVGVWIAYAADEWMTEVYVRRDGAWQCVITQKCPAE